MSRPSAGRLRRVATAAKRPEAGRPDAALARQERAAARADELAQRRATLARYRRLGTRCGQRRRFTGRTLYETPAPPLELSTGHLEAIYAFQTSATPPPTTRAAGPATSPSAPSAGSPPRPNGPTAG